MAKITMTKVANGYTIEKNGKVFVKEGDKNNASTYLIDQLLAFLQKYDNVTVEIQLNKTK